MVDVSSVFYLKIGTFIFFLDISILKLWDEFFILHFCIFFDLISLMCYNTK